MQQVVDHPVSCWSCKGPVDARALFCSVCGAVQGPGAVDHFTRLGLLPSFEINPALLQKHYFGFQQRLHPDRFATRSAKEKALSQQQAGSVNEAYETLKDPVRRAAYLLRLAGHPVEIDNSATISDPALLMEAMNMREALAAAQNSDEIAKIENDAQERFQASETQLKAAFAAKDYSAARSLTLRLKYLAKLAEEARAQRLRRILD
jgi:molecular chaperone HscB